METNQIQSRIQKQNTCTNKVCLGSGSKGKKTVKWSNPNSSKHMSAVVYLLGQVNQCFLFVIKYSVHFVPRKQLKITLIPKSTRTSHV